MRSQYVFVTSNQDPGQWYPKANDGHRDALLRRLSPKTNVNARVEGEIRYYAHDGSLMNWGLSATGGVAAALGGGGGGGGVQAEGLGTEVGH